MEPFYAEVRAVHIWSALASFSLFLLRGGAFNLFGARWALGGPLRYLSWAIDTILLTAALILTTIIQQAPFLNGWLTVKLLLLIPYVLLGHRALRADGRAKRWASFAGAIAIFCYIYSVARARDPLGFLA